MVPGQVKALSVPDLLEAALGPEMPLLANFTSNESERKGNAEERFAFVTIKVKNGLFKSMYVNIPFIATHTILKMYFSLCILKVAPDCFYSLSLLLSSSHSYNEHRISELF